MMRRFLPIFRRFEAWRERVRGVSLDRVNRVNAPARGRIAPGLILALALALTLPGAAMARDSLGVFGAWGAFRDSGEPKCYAIAKAEPSRLERQFDPFADVATWPRKGVRGQVHFRLSRKLAAGAQVVLNLGGQRFVLAGGGADAWAADRRMDAAVVAAMRSASQMSVNARDEGGRLFTNTYSLDGVANAMDAAAVGCAGLR